MAACLRQPCPSTSYKTDCLVATRIFSVRTCRQAFCNKQRVNALDTKKPTALESIDLEEAQIAGLNRDYCDDFVCNSSPAVEQSIRSFARELKRGRYATSSLFQKGVTYDDGFRSFTGPEGYSRQRWLADHVDGLKVSVLQMEMLDKSTAKINWRAVGQLGSNPVVLLFTTTLTLNLLTGRIETHKESWDLSQCPPPAAAYAAASRAVWSLQQRVKDLQEGLAKATEKLSSGGDSDASGVGNGTLDPTRFYMGGGNNNNNDVFAIGLVVALLYLAFKVFAELEGLH